MNKYFAIVLVALLPFIGCTRIDNSVTNNDDDRTNVWADQDQGSDDDEQCDLALSAEVDGTLVTLSIDGNEEEVFLFVDDELHPNRVDNEEVIELTPGEHELYVTEGDCESNIETVEIE